MKTLHINFSVICLKGNSKLQYLNSLFIYGRTHLGFIFISILGTIWAINSGLVLEYYLPIGILVTLIVNVTLLKEIRQYLSMMALLPLVSVVMLWIAPAIQYWVEAHRGGFSNLPMQVDDFTYFSVAIPGVLAICWAYYLPLPVVITHHEQKTWINTALLWCTKRKKWIISALIPAILLVVLTAYLPEGVRFIGTFCRSLIYIIAVWWFLETDVPYRSVGITLLWLLIGIEALQTTMFGEVISLSIILLTFGIFYKSFLAWKLWVGQFLFLGLLLWLLSFKYSYREYSESLPLNERVALFTKMAVDRFLNFNDPTIVDYGVARLGQGANMSMVLKYVPEKQDFVYGETIKNAIWASILPRLWWPGKPRAGGVDNIRRFMGIENLGYSINIGLVGESYVNYGRSIYFTLFLIGYVLFFRVLYTIALQVCKAYPLFIICLPIIFLPVISVEKDVFTVLNYVIKSSVLWAIVLWMYRITENKSIERQVVQKIRNRLEYLFVPEKK